MWFNICIDNIFVQIYPLVICFGNYWHLLMNPSKAKGPVTFVWRYSSNIVVCVAEIKLHMESFWAAPDPPMALSADWPTSYTLFLGNRIKIQARCVHFLRTIDSITPKCWDLNFLLLIKCLIFLRFYCGSITAQSGKKTLFYANCSSPSLSSSPSPSQPLPPLHPNQGHLHCWRICVDDSFTV